MVSQTLISNSGRWVTMVCKDYFKNLSEEEIDNYFNKIIGKIFACLKIYEKSTDDYEQLSTYIEHLILEFQGFNDLIEAENFISLVSTLNGINKNLSTINHKEMKSNIFYCIDAVKKGRNI